VRHAAPLVRRAVADGHELGVHGWRHRDLSGEPLRAAAELARAVAAIRTVSGVAPRLFRPPFGATSRRLAVAAGALGLVTVTWDVDPRDFEEPGADAIRSRVAAAVRPGSIVLLHDDRPGLAGTAAALDGILDDLAERGLAAVTVSLLLAARPSSSVVATPVPQEVHQPVGDDDHDEEGQGLEGGGLVAAQEREPEVQAGVATDDDAGDGHDACEHVDDGRHALPLVVGARVAPGPGHAPRLRARP
jgi:hypothetical protein